MFLIQDDNELYGFVDRDSELVTGINFLPVAIYNKWIFTKETVLHNFIT